MPLYLTGNPFTGKLTVPEGNWRAFAIGPRSDYDQLEIDGKLLSAGRILYMHVRSSVTVKYVRGPRAAFIDTNINHQSYESYEPLAELVCFDACDVVGNPGPRAPRTFKFRNRDIQGDSTHINEIIVPFAGRRHGRALITVLSPSTAGRTVKWCLMGRIWLREDDAVPAGSQGTASVGGYASGATAGGKPCVYVELDGCGTIAAPLTTASKDVVWTSGPDKAPVASSATVTNGKHVGGTNDAEYLDELALVYWPSTATTVDASIDIEVAGEEGCA